MYNLSNESKPYLPTQYLYTCMQDSNRLWPQFGCEKEHVFDPNHHQWRTGWHWNWQHLLSPPDHGVVQLTSQVHQPRPWPQSLTTKTHPINKEAKISVKHSPCSASNDVEPRPPQGLLARQIALVICTVWIIMVFQAPCIIIELFLTIPIPITYLRLHNLCTWLNILYIYSISHMLHHGSVHHCPYQPAWGSKFTNQLVSPKPNQPLAWKPNFFLPSCSNDHSVTSSHEVKAEENEGPGQPVIILAN